MSGALYNPSYGEGYNPAGGYTQLTVTPEDNPAAEVQEEIQEEDNLFYTIPGYQISCGDASPIGSNDTSGSTSGSAPGVAPGEIPGLGTTAANPLSAVASWWDSLIGDIENFGERFGIILLAIAIAIVALRQLVK